MEMVFLKIENGRFFLRGLISFGLFRSCLPTYGLELLS